MIIWKEVAEGQYQIVYQDDSAKSCVNQVRFCPLENGLRLAAACSDGHIAIYSYDERSSTWSRSSFLAHPAGALSVAWAPAGCTSSPEPAAANTLEGAKILSGGMDHAVRVHKYETNIWVKEELDASRISHSDWVVSVSWRVFTGSQDLVASAGRDGAVIVWHSQNGCWRPVKVFKDEFGGQPVWTVNFSQVGCGWRWDTTTRGVSVPGESRVT